MFSVNLEVSEDNKGVYQIKGLQNTVVEIELPRTIILPSIQSIKHLATQKTKPIVTGFTYV